MSKEKRIGNEEKKVVAGRYSNRKTNGAMILPFTATDTDKWLQ